MQEDILVTGGASFIGSHLLEALLEKGHRVSVLDDFSSGREENLNKVASDTQIYKGSARDTFSLEKALRGKDSLIHLAANHGGRGYIESHELECMSNIGLDHLVFKTAGQLGISKIIYASSACVYPVHLQKEPVFLKESDATWREPEGSFADGAYGWAKLIGEMQLEIVKKEYGLKGASARIFTSYGERENLTHALPALLAKAMLRKDPYPVWGDGQQTRNFTHVLDTVQGLIYLFDYAKEYEQGESAVNVGLGEHISINNLIEEIFSLVGWRPEVVNYQVDAPVGVSFRASDNTLSRKLFSWEPKTPLKEGLYKTMLYLEGQKKEDLEGGFR